MKELDELFNKLIKVYFENKEYYEGVHDSKNEIINDAIFDTISSDELAEIGRYIIEKRTGDK